MGVEMSVVTNFILAVRPGSHTAQTAIDILDGYFQDINHYYGSYAPFRALHDGNRNECWYAGNKHLECDLLVGAFNHLNLDDFIMYLQGAS